MTVKEYNIGVYEEDGVEYGIANEVSLIGAIKRIKFGGTTRYYVDSDETLEIEDQENYNITGTMFCSGSIILDGILGVH